MGKLLKNNKGEYNYHFHWIDEEGTYVGFNDVWAKNKREAVKKAKAMESPAKVIFYNIIVDGGIEQTSSWYKGMYVDVSSMKKATREYADRMTRLGNMLSS